MKLIRVLFLPLLMATSGAWAQGPSYQVGVNGLSCPFCAYGIEKQIHKLDGVKQVKVDIGKGQVVISMDDDRTLEEAQVEAAVKRSGFSLRSFEQSQERVEK
jgi:copper chaperone CopZ